MYLARLLIVDIMLQGQWSLDAFILYIHHAVLERSLEVLTRIVEKDNFTILLPQDNITLLSCTSSFLSYGITNISSHITFLRFYLYY